MENNFSDGLISVYELVDSFSFLLLDNSCFQCFKNSKEVKYNKSLYRDILFFMKFLIEQPKDSSPLYFIPSIINEMKNFNFRVNRRGTQDLVHKANHLKTEIAFSYPKEEKLKFGPLERSLYGIYFKRFSYLRIHFGVSEVDLDLSLTGLVFQNMRGNTAILTNDFGILSFVSYLSKKDYLKGSTPDLFYRKGFPYFKKFFVR